MIDFDNVSASLFAMINFPFWVIVTKSTIAIALAALACTLLGRQSAAMRHRVWVFGLAASLVVPMASSLLPQFTLRVLPEPGIHPSWSQQKISDRHLPLIPLNRPCLIRLAPSPPTTSLCDLSWNRK